MAGLGSLPLSMSSTETTYTYWSSGLAGAFRAGSLVFDGAGVFSAVLLVLLWEVEAGGPVVLSGLGIGFFSGGLRIYLQCCTLDMMLRTSTDAINEPRHNSLY